MAGTHYIYRTLDVDTTRGKLLLFDSAKESEAPQPIEDVPDVISALTECGSQGWRLLQYTPHSDDPWPAGVFLFEGIAPDEPEHRSAPFTAAVSGPRRSLDAPQPRRGV